MKAVKYTLNNDNIRYLMSTDNQLNMLMKYIENTEPVIELDGFSCLIKYIIRQQISDKARQFGLDLKQRIKILHPNKYCL